MTTNTIKFRNKFEKILNDENRSVIMSAFEKFFNFKTEVARDYLWSLTYNIDIAMLVLEELGLNRNIITLENISALRNELRFQYKELNPKFLACEVPKSCKEAFAALESKADIIVANIVYRNCAYCVYDKEAFERILFLLKSDKENLRFGGIRSMNFGPDEADYLKPFHVEIYELLKACYGYHDETANASKNRPFAGLDEHFKEDSLELPFELENLPEPLNNKVEETISEYANEVKASEIECGESEEKGELEPASVTVEETEQNNDVKIFEIAASKNIAAKSTEMTSEVQVASEFKKLTPEEILAHRAVFYVFTKSEDLNVLTPIGILGFDLNEVMTKKEKIFNFLNAASALSE